MKVKGFTIVVALATSLSVGTTAYATSYTGSLTTDDGGLTGLGSWTDPGSTLTWNVSFSDQTNLWSYEYTLCVSGGGEEDDSIRAADDDDDDDDDGCKGVSHVVIEASASFTQADLLNDDPNNAEVGSHGSGNGNPDIPSTVYGIKFEIPSGGEGEDSIVAADDDEGGTCCVTVSFDTYRSPVWGDFYAKGGKEDPPCSDGKDGGVSVLTGGAARRSPCSCGTPD